MCICVDRWAPVVLRVHRVVGLIPVVLVCRCTMGGTRGGAGYEDYEDDSWGY